MAAGKMNSSAIPMSPLSRVRLSLRAPDCPGGAGGGTRVRPASLVLLVLIASPHLLWAAVDQGRTPDLWPKGDGEEGRISATDGPRPTARPVMRTTPGDIVPLSVEVASS